jgi:hypothetical protein
VRAYSDFLISDQAFLESLVAEVEKNVEGRRVKVEGEDDKDDGAKEYGLLQVVLSHVHFTNIIYRS